MSARKRHILPRCAFDRRGGGKIPPVRISYTNVRSSTRQAALCAHNKILHSSARFKILFVSGSALRRGGHSRADARTLSRPRRPSFRRFFGDSRGLRTGRKRAGRLQRRQRLSLARDLSLSRSRQKILLIFRVLTGLTAFTLRGRTAYNNTDKVKLKSHIFLRR